MHILMFADRTASLGGIETHVATLAKELCRLGQRVTVAFPRIERPDLFSVALEAGAELVEAGRADVAHLVRSERVDLVHAHSHGATVAGAELSRAFGIPWAVTLHSPGQLRPPLGSGRLACICVSEEIARSFGKHRSLVRVIENGVDLERFRPAGRAFSAAWRRRAPLRVVYLGRVGPSKAAGLVALEEAVRSLPEVELSYISDWSPGNDHTPSADVSRMLRGADVVVSTGRGVREAMACGAAACVMGAFWDGLVTPETVERLGYYNFSGRSSRTRPTPALIRGELGRLLSDPGLLGALGRFGAAHAAAAWDARVAAFHTLDVYLEIR